MRFLAALLVLLAHIEAVKNAIGIKFINHSFIQSAAQLSVTFFFVLSGFLITYLLLKEKQQNEKNRIAIKRFYIKRVLRIWPLYYLVVLIAFLVLGQISFFSIPFGKNNDFNSYLYWDKFSGYLLLLPNYTTLKDGGFVYTSPLWSLGVEEFLYLFFPLVIFYISSSRIVTFLIILIVISVSFSTFAQLFLNNLNEVQRYIKAYASAYRLYSFALGGLAAYFFLNKNLTKENTLMRLLSNKLLVIAGLLLVIVFVCLRQTFSIINQFVYSVFFACIILGILFSNTRLWFINSPLIKYLGRISYGIYMLHPIMIVVCVKLLISIGFDRSRYLFDILLYPSAVMLTILISIFSFECYEKFFLKFAKKQTHH